MAKLYNQFRNLIPNLPDYTLLDIVQEEANQYRPEALTIAEEEIARRGLEVRTTSDTGNNDENPTTAHAGGQSVGMRWFKAYTYVLLPFGALQTLYHWSMIDLGGIGFLFFSWTALTIYGLVKRKQWGWQSNMALLYAWAIWNPLILALQYQSVLLFVILIGLAGVGWVWPNRIYFTNRRQLFKPR